MVDTFPFIILSSKSWSKDGKKVFNEVNSVYGPVHYKAVGRCSTRLYYYIGITKVFPACAYRDIFISSIFKK